MAHIISRRAVLMVAIAVSIRFGVVVLEVRVVASLLGRDTAGRVVYKQHLKKIKTLLVKVRTDGEVIVADPLRKRGLEVRVRGDAWPDLLSRGAEKTV